MSDDPSVPGRVEMNWPFSLETSERLLLTPDEMDARTDRQLRDMIKGLIDSVETGTRDGADKIAVIARAQYYIQELARREQDCQTKVMTEHTKTVKDYTVMIGIMTILVTIVSFVSMIVTVWAVVHPH